MKKYPIDDQFWYFFIFPRWFKYQTLKVSLYGSPRSDETQKYICNNNFTNFLNRFDYNSQMGLPFRAPRFPNLFIFILLINYYYPYVKVLRKSKYILRAHLTAFFIY